MCRVASIWRTQNMSQMLDVIERSLKRSPRLKYVFILLCVHCYVPTDAITHFMYMTNHCTRSVQVMNSVLLALMPQTNLAEDRTGDFLQCDLNVTAPKGMRLFVHFLQLGISPVVEHSDRNFAIFDNHGISLTFMAIPGPRLQLYDLTLNKTRLTPIKGLYGRLDRAQAISDEPGAKICDYRTISNTLKVEYLGIPTKATPGFRLILTPFQDLTSSGGCLARHFHCRHAGICVPRQLVCDGNPNCGNDDGGDEDGCDRNDTVTNLLSEYSLARDIIVIILLPLVIFIAIVIAVFLTAKRHISKKTSQSDTPIVRFKQEKGGQIRITEINGTYAPPSYEDIMELPAGYEPPPAYNGSAVFLKRAGVDSVQSQDTATLSCVSEEIGQFQTLKKKKIFDLASAATEEDMISGGFSNENCRLHCIWSSDTEGDKDLNEKSRRKGGKGKMKKKMDDKVNDIINDSMRKLSVSFSSQGEPTSCNKPTTSVPCNRVEISAHVCNPSAFLPQPHTMQENQ